MRNGSVASRGESLFLCSIHGADSCSLTLCGGLTKRGLSVPSGRRYNGPAATRGDEERMGVLGRPGFVY